MKKTLIYAGALLITALVSCTKEEHFVLENTYHLDKVLVAKAEGFSDELYKFTLEIAEEGVSGAAGSYSGSGKVVSYTLYGDKYYLETSIYSAVAQGSETKASYVPAQSEVYDVKDGKATPLGIKSGYVYISNNNGAYRFSSTTTLSDGSEFKYVGGSSVSFPKLPKYKYLNTLIMASPDASGVYQMDFTNGEVIVHMEFLGSELKDGVHEGDTGYKKGFLNDTYAAWGAVWDEGSRITNPDGSVISYITTSKVTVSTLDNGNRRVEVDCDDVIYIFEGRV